MNKFPGPVFDCEFSIRLIAGHGAQSADGLVLVQHVPEALGAAARQRMLDLDGPAQLYDILGSIGSLDSLPSGIVIPFAAECFYFLASVELGCGPRRLAGYCYLLSYNAPEAAMLCGNRQLARPEGEYYNRIPCKFHIKNFTV